MILITFVEAAPLLLIRLFKFQLLTSTSANSFRKALLMTLQVL